MMQIIHSRQELISIREAIKESVSFVPTMGNLHQGHLDLITQAAELSPHLFVSIYVNPKQFNDPKDFERYPKTLKADVEKITALNLTSKITIFAPANDDDIYPENFSTIIDIPSLSTILEGEQRPGHFRGVCTVVYQLFELVKPNHAIFGKKDYQQLTIIKKMVKDLSLGIQIHAAETQRESSGLAMSSRNQFLSQEAKEKALVLPRVLKILSGEIKNSSLSHVTAKAKELKNNPIWNYLEICDQKTLLPATTQTRSFVILGSITLDNVRLIDNIEVEK